MSYSEALIRKRRREPMDERTPDGRTVAELVRQSAQILTPQNQEAITRPRQVTAPSPQTPPPEPAQSLGDQSSVRARRTQPRDFIADDESYLRDLEKKKDPFWKRLIAQSIRGAQAGTGHDPAAILTSLEQERADVGNRIGQEVKVAKDRSTIEAGQMVDVELENGQHVMVPRRQAGTLQSQQQRIKQAADTLNERKTVNENRKKHWDAMDSRDRKRMIVSLYNSGGLNDPDLLDYAADQLGLPAVLREKFIQGKMRGVITESGEIGQQNLQTGQVKGSGVQSFEKAKEAGRERRAQAGIASREKVAQMPARAQTGRGAAPDRATNRRAAQLIGTIERARREMEAADARGDQKSRESARLIGEQSAAELNALGAGYEAGPGEKGYPYYKKSEGGQASGEDPKIRAYANKFFSGNYAAAQAAIAEQRKQ